MVSLVFLKVNSLVDAFNDRLFFLNFEGVILTCLLLFGSAGILKVWTGLIVSPFRSWIRIRSGLGFRRQDGYMEQEHGSILPGGRSRNRLCPHNPIKPETKLKLNWHSDNPNYFFPFCVGPQRHDY